MYCVTFQDKMKFFEEFRIIMQIELSVSLAMEYPLAASVQCEFFDFGTPSWYIFQFIRILKDMLVFLLLSEHLYRISTQSKVSISKINAAQNWNTSSEVNFNIFIPLSKMHFKSIVLKTCDAYN